MNLNRNKTMRILSVEIKNKEAFLKYFDHPENYDEYYLNAIVGAWNAAIESTEPVKCRPQFSNNTREQEIKQSNAPSVGRN